MHKEWFFQFLVLFIYFVSSIVYVEHEGLIISNSIGIDLLFFVYHVLLFLLVNFVLIPKLFYTKKYLLFFLALIGCIILFGIIEEGVIEKLLSPNSRGRNAVTWQSIYWFAGEILVPLLAFTSVKLVFDNFAQQQKLQQIKQDNLKNELQLLKSQIQPHILFNSLNNLYHFALEKSDSTPELILKLSNVLRYILYETSDEKVSLAKELSFLKDYIDLQIIQYKGRGTIDYTIEAVLEDTSLKIAPFLLIPFIENSFKHSFGTKVKDVSIAIKIYLQEQDIHLEVVNNFEANGNPRESLTHGGIGLVNVKKRLDLLYPDAHHLHIEQNKEQYHVKLNVKAE